MVRVRPAVVFVHHENPGPGQEPGNGQQGDQQGLEAKSHARFIAQVQRDVESAPATTRSQGRIGGGGILGSMAHTTRHKRRFLNRARRIRGQVLALERALEREEDCSRVLHLIAACRGALNGLMAEVLDGHVRTHVLDPRRRTASQTRAAEDLLAVINAYLR